MRSWMLIAVLVACNADSDNDGLTNAEERELGTGLAVSDTDGDGLDDGAEVLEHGTDPLAADSDLDGFSDGEEVDALSDPLDPLSYPDTRWPDARERVPDEARSWELGQHVPDFSGTDQRGDSLALDQLYGHVVVVQLVAGTFCPACQTVTDTAAALQQARRDEGLLLVQVLVDDDTRDGELQSGFAAVWAERQGLDSPVLVGPQAALGLFEAGLYDGNIPLTVLLDRGHRLSSVGTGSDGLDQAVESLDLLLAQPVP